MIKIKVEERQLDVEQKQEHVKISINTLFVERGMTYWDIIALYNKSLSDLEGRIKAKIDEEVEIRITEDEALARYQLELSTQFNNNSSAVSLELLSMSNELGAMASAITTVTAKSDNIEVTLQDYMGVYAGYFKWSTEAEIGNLKTIGTTTYQYLGGNMGPLADGWVVYNSTALGSANQVKGWVAGAASLVVDPVTKQVTGWQYGDGSGFNSFFKISANNIELSGTSTFSSFVQKGDPMSYLTDDLNYLLATEVQAAIENNVTTISGSKITTGTIAADRIAANVLYGKQILIDSNNNPQATSANGGTLGLFNSQNGQNFNALAGVNYNTSNTGNGIQGEHKGSGVGVRGVSASGVGVNGDTFNGAGEWGFFTAYKARAANFSPFTGSHIAYTQDTSLQVGQLVYSIDAWTVDVSQTLVHVAKTTTPKDKRVFGVVNYIKHTLMDNIEKDVTLCNKTINEETGEEVFTIKPEYQPYVQYMQDNDFVEVSVNALGEGGILVCNENGNIDNGDYLTSANLAGYACKQDDDLLHSYTVAKALESVDWANEPQATKLIACTYHAG